MEKDEIREIIRQEIRVFKKEQNEIQIKLYLWELLNISRFGIIDLT